MNNQPQDPDQDQDPPSIQNFRERAAIMEYDAFPSEPEPDEAKAKRRRQWATLEAAKLVWKQEFTLTTLKVHLTSLRNQHGSNAA